MKKVAILGASGSIGTQTIDILKNNKNQFELIGFSVGKNIDYANELISEFNTLEKVCIQNADDIDKIKFDNIVSGSSGLIDIATLDVDILITAVVGFVGLVPTVEAIKKGIDIGLANKETLVTAGHIIMPLAKENNVNIYPVDSEHSAIFQCLNGENVNKINKLLITASGGSFRDKSRDELASVTIDDALNHPNWSMGKKITIDSATMFNKGLEVIEAHHLFDVAYDDIEVVIHKQSIIHSMVQFDDYSIIAQLGSADMRLPISYALTYPKRIEIKNSKPINLFDIKKFDFKDVDINRYPAVALSYKAGSIGGSMPTVLNAANEVAVDLFLNDKIKFLDIENIVKQQMDIHDVIKNPTLDQIIEVDKIVRDNVYGIYK